MGVHQPQEELFSYQVNLDNEFEPIIRCAGWPKR
jgi:hypothetical protein